MAYSSYNTVLYCGVIVTPSWTNSTIAVRQSNFILFFSSVSWEIRNSLWFITLGIPCWPSKPNIYREDHLTKNRLKSVRQLESRLKVPAFGHSCTTVVSQAGYPKAQLGWQLTRLPVLKPMEMSESEGSAENLPPAYGRDSREFFGATSRNHFLSNSKKRPVSKPIRFTSQDPFETSIIEDSVNGPEFVRPIILTIDRCIDWLIAWLLVRCFHPLIDWLIEFY
jgi:hypothetical protein